MSLPATGNFVPKLKPKFHVRTRHEISAEHSEWQTPVTPTSSTEQVPDLTINHGIKSKDRAWEPMLFQTETSIPQNQTNECGSLGCKQKTGLRYKEKMGITLGSGLLLQDNGIGLLTCFSELTTAVISQRNHPLFLELLLFFAHYSIATLQQ